MKFVGYLTCLIFGVVIGYLLLLLGVVDVVDRVPGTLEEPALALPTYLGFMSVMLTAVTVVLAAVAIGIGVVAAYTFREIREEVLKAAGIKVNSLIAEKLSDNAIQVRILKSGLGKAQRVELESDFDPNDSGER
jgi:hypothetical protein